MTSKSAEQFKVDSSCISNDSDLTPMVSAVPRSLDPVGFVWLFMVLLVCSGSMLRAQEFRGTIAGRITDPSGAVVQNAVISATGPQQTYTAKTGRDGSFAIQLVQPATYAISVSAKGFKQEVREGVIVDINTKVNFDAELLVGSDTETVTVQANNEVFLDTLDASGGSVMETEKLQNLPLNGRQLYMLLGLTPGTSFNQTQFGQSGYSGTRGWDESNNYTINGQGGSENQFSLNGAPVSQQNGGGSGTWNISPNVDAVAEFKILSNTYDAQYGRYAGGNVNTILKSGTRQYHGTVYDFFRNSVFDANSYNLKQTGTKKPFHNQHQFGGTVGGPVWKNKNKLFFFGSFESFREVLPGSLTSSVPTADMLPDASGNVNLTNYLNPQNGLSRTGIFDPLTTTCAQPTSNGCNQYTRAQFANNIIPASRISPIALKILKLFPAPNLPGERNNFLYTGKNPYKINQPIARIDYNLSDATKFYGMFAWWSGTENRNGNGFTGPAEKGNISSYRSSLTQVLDLTHTFNARLVGDARLSFNRAWNKGPDGTVADGSATLTAADLGLSMPAIPTTSRTFAPEINIDDLPGIIGNQGDPNIFETYDLSVSLTHLVKQHNLHYGVETMLFHDVSGGVGDPNGTFHFGSNFTQSNPNQFTGNGSGYATFLLGYASDGSVQDSLPPYESYKYYGAFIQDNWRVTPKLALNVGLRWDDETSPVERNHHLLAGICLTCRNSISDQIPGGIVLPNGATMVSPINGVVQFSNSNLSAYANTKGNFEPKFGLSYQITDKLVMRGGYGYNASFGIELGGASPWSQTTQYVGSPDGGLTPALGFRNGTPFASGYTHVVGDSLGALTLLGDGQGFDQRDRKLAISQQYSFGFESQLPFQMISDVEYVGARGGNLRTSRQLDGLSAADFQKGVANPGYLDQQVTNPFYGVLPKSTSLGSQQTVQAKALMVPYPQFNGNLYIYTHADGYSNYHALQTKLEKRFTEGGVFSRGLSFLGSFTWSKLMSATGYLNNNGEGLVDSIPFYGLDGNNRPWVFAFSGLYGLPIGNGGMLFSKAHGLAGLALNDWQVEWIFQNQAGTPVGYPNNDNYICGSYNIQPAQKSYKSYINNSNPSCWAHFNEFEAKTAGGNSTAVRQPWTQQTQLGLEKKFPITESTKLQFKAEAFNATNTPLFGGVSTGNPENAPTRNTAIADPTQPGAWSGYGTIGNLQQNFPRQLQVSLKILF